MDGWTNAWVYEPLCSPTWPYKAWHHRDGKVGGESLYSPVIFYRGLNSAQSIFLPLSIYSGQSVPYQMSSRLVGNMCILFDNIFFFQFCFAAQTFVCFAVCCASDRIQTNCFGFLNCFVFSIQLSLISFPFLHLTLLPKFQPNPQWERTISLLLGSIKGSIGQRSEKAQDLVPRHHQHARYSVDHLSYLGQLLLHKIKSGLDCHGIKVE